MNLPLSEGAATASHPGIAGRLSKAYREGGVAGVLCRAAGRLRRVAVRGNSAFWFERELADDLPRGTVVPGAVFDFEGTRATCEWLAAHGEGWMRDPRELALARRERHRYPNVLLHGEFAGYVKVARGRVYIGDYGKVLDVPGDAAFIYDTYVAEPFRGRGLASFMVSETMRRLQREGIHRIGCHIPGWNTASIRTYERLGFERRRHVRFLRLMGIRLYSSRPRLFSAAPCGGTLVRGR